MSAPMLAADCAKCCGLCCVAPAFDAEQGFGYSKPAHTPCTNLRRDNRCTVHHALNEHGFPACASFDCHGAGQRVTQALFGGRSWRTSPEIAREMFRAYFRYRSLHELMALLQAAISKSSPPDAQHLRRSLESIDDLCETGAALDDSVSVSAIRR